MRGYEHANNIALDLWEEVYPTGLTLLALTDTFSTKAFFQVRARLFSQLTLTGGSAQIPPRSPLYPVK
jgi:nicotinic acid phosphoribosyltransferase